MNCLRKCGRKSKSFYEYWVVIRLDGTSIKKEKFIDFITTYLNKKNIVFDSDKICVLVDILLLGNIGIVGRHLDLIGEPHLLHQVDERFETLEKLIEKCYVYCPGATKTLLSLFNLNFLELTFEFKVEEINDYFNRCAKYLFQNFHIKKNEKRYDFLDVEFHFIKVKNVEELGKWLFHKSGAYISLGYKIISLGNLYSGKIRLRCMLKKEAGKAAKVITGARKCADELLEDFYAVFEDRSSSSLPYLHEHEHKPVKVKSCVYRLPFCNKKSDVIKEKREIQDPWEFFKYRNATLEECTFHRYRYYRPDYVKLSVNNR